MKIVMTNISEVQPEDTVVIDDKYKTVGKNDIRHDKFWGFTLFGINEHYFENKKVPLVLFPKYYKGKLVGYVR